MMDGIRNIKVIFLSQIFIFYATIEIWIMNSFGSPENFVFLCSYLIAGLCVKSLNKPKNYFNNNKFVSISALLCTISATSHELFAKILAFPISNHYSITNKNNSKIWTKNICVKNKNICVDFKVPINFSKCLAYFHIIDSKALLGNTFNELKIEDLKKITIQASNNKSNWKTVYKINNDYHSKKSLSLHSDATSKKGEFILNIKSGFNYYKLIFPKNNKKLIDKEFNFLFKKGCI